MQDKFVLTLSQSHVSIDNINAQTNKQQNNDDVPVPIICTALILDVVVQLSLLRHNRQTVPSPAHRISAHP